MKLTLCLKKGKKKLREQIWKKKKRQKILFMYVFGSKNEKKEKKRKGKKTKEKIMLKNYFLFYFL